MTSGVRDFRSIIGAVLATIILCGCSPSRGYEAALLVADIGAVGRPSVFQRTTPPPAHRSIRYTVADRSYRAESYIPGNTPLAGIVLVHGMAAAGPEDARLVAFATSLARARFTVFIPELRGLRALRASIGDVRAIADAFAYLSTRSDLAPRGRIGIGAFSYGAGPAILAALEPDIRREVRFVLAVGGYHDLRNVITFFTTGYFRVGDEWRYLEPNEYGKWLFVLSNLYRLAAPRDRRILKAMAERKLQDLSAPIADLADGLSPEGQAVYALITNDDPRRVAALLARQPATIRADLEALNLANKALPQLRARVILLHGRDDNIIPYTESIALQRRLGTGADLFLVDGLHHVDVRPGAADLYRLWRAAYALLAMRASDSAQPGPDRSG